LVRIEQNNRTLPNDLCAQEHTPFAGGAKHGNGRSARDERKFV
jgi:hypothetical protein